MVFLFFPCPDWREKLNKNPYSASCLYLPRCKPTMLISLIYWEEILPKKQTFSVTIKPFTVSHPKRKPSAAISVPQHRMSHASCSRLPIFLKCFGSTTGGRCVTSIWHISAVPWWHPVWNGFMPVRAIATVWSGSVKGVKGKKGNQFMGISSKLPLCLTKVPAGMLPETIQPAPITQLSPI